jgi:hypothetical protein
MLKIVFRCMAGPECACAPWPLIDGSAGPVRRALRPFLGLETAWLLHSGAAGEPWCGRIASRPAIEKN